MKHYYSLKDDLNFCVLSEFKEIDTIALEMGVSRRTIFNVLNGENVDDTTTERIYSYFYKEGYRFNEIKEEIYINTYPKRNVYFHGSKKGIHQITNDGSRNDCDFGSGFYMSERFVHAASFVCDKEKSTVYVLEIDFKDLSILNFDIGLDWMIAICYYRKTISKYNDHPIVKKIINKINKSDIIIAPIADNRMFYIMQLFASGEITTTEAMNALAASNLGKQVAIKSKRAVEQIKIIDELYLCNEEKEEFISSLNKRSNEVDNQLKEAKRKYKGEGQYIDELFS